MGVRKRKQRKEGERLPANRTAATPNPDPVVILVVRLLAAMPVSHNRIALTDRTQAYDDLVAVVGPAGSKLPQPGRYWDKEDRYLKGASLSDVDPPRSQPAAKLLLLKKNPTERNITSYSQPRSLGSAYWPVISLNSSFENERPCALESRRGWRLKANLYREQSVPPQSGWKHATWRWPRKDSCVRSPLSVAVNALVQRWFRRLQRGAGSIVLYR